MSYNAQQEKTFHLPSYIKDQRIAWNPSTREGEKRVISSKPAWTSRQHCLKTPKIINKSIQGEGRVRVVRERGRWNQLPLQESGGICSVLPHRVVLKPVAIAYSSIRSFLASFK